MKRRFNFGLLLTLLATTLLPACRVSQPGQIETAVVGAVKRSITVGGRNDTNPLAATAENIRAGQVVFSYYCISCHGLDGQKTGVPFADQMSPPVPSLAAPAVQRYTDGQLLWVIKNGLYPSGMPAAKGTLNNEEMWQIVVYLRHLPPAGSLGDPPAYSGHY